MYNYPQYPPAPNQQDGGSVGYFAQASPSNSTGVTRPASWTQLMMNNSDAGNEQRAPNSSTAPTETTEFIEIHPNQVRIQPSKAERQNLKNRLLLNTQKLHEQFNKIRQNGFDDPDRATDDPAKQKKQKRCLLISCCCVFSILMIALLVVLIQIIVTYSASQMYTFKWLPPALLSDGQNDPDQPYRKPSNEPISVEMSFDRANQRVYTTSRIDDDSLFNSNYMRGVIDFEKRRHVAIDQRLKNYCFVFPLHDYALTYDSFSTAVDDTSTMQLRSSDDQWKAESNWRISIVPDLMRKEYGDYSEGIGDTCAQGTVVRLDPIKFNVPCGRDDCRSFCLPDYGISSCAQVALLHRNCFMFYVPDWDSNLISADEKSKRQILDGHYRRLANEFQVKHDTMQSNWVKVGYQGPAGTNTGHQRQPHLSHFS